jgi:hypothetical protein
MAGTTVISAKSQLYPFPKARYTLKVLPIPTELVLIEYKNNVVTDQTVDGVYGVDMEVRGMWSRRIVLPVPHL